MSRIERTIVRALATGAVAFVAMACDSSKGSGSETHFVACTADEECPPATPACISGKCSLPTSPSTDGGAPPDAANGDSGIPMCGPQPPSINTCTQFCGSDRMLEMVCTESGWQCPEETPVRVSDCPSDTCWFPGANCCASDGQLVPGSCPDGGEMVCPEGSFRPDPLYGCDVTQAVSTSCTHVTDCALTSASCCASCDTPMLGDFVAVNVTSKNAYRDFVCAGTSPCSPCVPEPTPTFYAICQEGQCAPLDVAPMAECTVDADCQVVARNCCDCSVLDPPDVVAVSDVNAYRSLACAAGEVCSLPCVPTINASAACVGGVCIVTP